MKKKQYIRPVTEELTTNSGANLLAGSLPHNSLGQNSTPVVDFDEYEDRLSHYKFWPQNTCRHRQ